MDALSTLNILGAADLAVMMVFYALEPKSRTYTLLFGLTCIGSSTYGFLSGTWPFGVIEAVWTVIALRKFVKLKKEKRMGSPG